MRQDLKKSVSIMIERDVNVLSFGSDFIETRALQGVGVPSSPMCIRKAIIFFQAFTSAFLQLFLHSGDPIIEIGKKFLRVNAYP